MYQDFVVERYSEFTLVKDKMNVTRICLQTLRVTVLVRWPFILGTCNENNLTCVQRKLSAVLLSLYIRP